MCNFGLFKLKRISFVFILNVALYQNAMGKINRFEQFIQG